MLAYNLNYRNTLGVRDQKVAPVGALEGQFESTDPPPPKKYSGPIFCDGQRFQNLVLENPNVTEISVTGRLTTHYQKLAKVAGRSESP